MEIKTIDLYFVPVIRFIPSFDMWGYKWSQYETRYLFKFLFFEFDVFISKKPKQKYWSDGDVIKEMNELKKEQNTLFNKNKSTSKGGVKK